ncbi:hypothetical protein C6496_03100 [Candidatus Poribacteria bacterium]|nr:MAG: hypothetical protein C6496_03100 [Candidatus Poribacteria bacterium]
MQDSNSYPKAEVYVEYFEYMNRWLIFESESGEVVKGYSNESNCMFDYAALRNGETSIDLLRHDGIQVGDRVHPVGFPSSLGTVVKAEEGVITAKMDNRSHESTTQFSAASSWVKL